VAEVIDLRSDTVTRPTEGMLRAMAAAPTGDDVYGEDPTVNALEERVAGLLGHEAAVFVPTGTMGNQICLQLVVPPAEELLCGAEDHVVTYEHGGAARYGGISSRTLAPARGLLTADDVATQLRPAGWGTVATRAVSVEQTHNRGGGAVHPLASLEELRSATSAHGVRLHCDGARIWNASVASGTPLDAYGRLFDTLSVCMSKGLGAPVGSLVVLAVAVGFASAANGTLATFVVTAGVEAGLGESAAGLVLTLGSATGISMRLAAGRRADRRGGRHLPVVSMLLLGGAVGYLLLAPGELWTHLLGALVAFGSGWAWPGLFNLAIVRLNPGAPGAATGITQTGVYVGALAGPVLFGLVVEAAGYPTAWVLAAVSSAGAAGGVRYGRSRVLAWRRMHASAASSTSADHR